MNRILGALLVLLALGALALSVTRIAAPAPAAPVQAVPTLLPGQARVTPQPTGALALPTLPPPPSQAAAAQTQLFSVSSALKPKSAPALTDITPEKRIIPDSELVYGPSAIGFNTQSFLAARAGYINQYSERILNGENLSGPQIVERVAQQFSVHPRLLIALLEYEGGWVNSASVSSIQRQRPYGNVDGLRNSKLYLQMTWAAAMLNQGYYGWRLGTRPFVQMGDRDAFAAIPASLNAGSAGVQNYLAAITPRAEWDVVFGADKGSFLATYRELFGDPWQFDRNLPIPPNTRQPPLRLPFAPDERWHLTGGPHSSWGSGSNWGALDFTPQNGGGCGSMPNWVLSMSDGNVVRSQSGEVMISLDPGRDERAGWAVLYMHIGSQERAGTGPIKSGDRIGHPSCEGGQAIAAHLHTARKFNGEWVSASGAIPFVMDGFVSYETPGGEFQGALVRGDVVRIADESRNIALNGVP